MSDDLGFVENKEVGWVSSGDLHRILGYIIQQLIAQQAKINGSPDDWWLLWIGFREKRIYTGRATTRLMETVDEMMESNRRWWDKLGSRIELLDKVRTSALWHNSVGAPSEQIGVELARANVLFTLPPLVVDEFPDYPDTQARLDTLRTSYLWVSPAASLITPDEIGDFKALLVRQDGEPSENK